MGDILTFNGCSLTIDRRRPSLDRQILLCRHDQGVFTFAVEGVLHAVKRDEVGISKHHGWNRTEKMSGTRSIDCLVYNLTP